MRFVHALALVFLISATAVCSGEDLKVPIFLNKPERLATRTWPVSVGIPFKKSEFRDANELTIVGEDGRSVPCQITKTGDWEDGSLRWVLADFTPQLDRKYFLTRGPKAETKDDITIREDDSGIVVQTGGAEYTFPKGSASFDSLRLGADVLVSGGAKSFYIVDSQGTRGVLNGKSSVEMNGKRHAVIRTEGEYQDQDGKRKAAGVVYFHFYAGNKAVRISHKLIVTEDTNDLWFRDIGIELGFAGGIDATATFNSLGSNPQETLVQKLGATGTAHMLQKELAHFGSTNGVGFITSGDETGTLHTAHARYLEGARGNWADVSSSRGGLAAQVPGFAEQFPKAFRVSATNFTIKLWASESGQELDYRTPQITSNYFGHDWIPTNNPVATIANTAAGTAKIHEIWLYPHVGPLTPEISAGFGATKEEIYAYADPAWVARSEVMGPMHPKDTQQFGEAEEVISSYFDRWVLAGDKVFPATGYLYWGMYPYSAQPWKPKDGRWYPSVHRLSRSLEYNLKRGMWVLFARSGERKYFDYARRYTRLIGNLLFSNCDAPLKPRGWMVQGSFHSPIIWGAFGEDSIKAGKTGRLPAWNGEASFLSVASSEDVIQFVYDYFLTGDLHSRDMARLYTEAFIKESDFDVEKTLLAGGSRPEAFMRLLGSAYDLDHDPRLREYGQKLLRRMVLPDGELNVEIPTGYGKWGEVFGAYYYYYVSTGDPLAKKALIHLAQILYRRADLEAFFSRSSPLLQSFALAYQETGDPAYAAYLNQVVGNFARHSPTLKKEGIDFGSLNQLTSTPWGQETMTGQGPVNIGVPVAEAVLANYKGPRPHLPFAIKPYPTQTTHFLLKKESKDAATLDVFVNNWGDRTVEPRLKDMQGKDAKLEIVERDFHRCSKPDFTRDGGYSKWYQRYEDQIFFKLRIPASVPPGVYHLGLGSEVSFTVLNTDLTKIQQVAPDGLVLDENERHYFSVPPGKETVEFFAMQPVKIFDANGKEVAIEDLQNGNYRFQTGGQSGTWWLVRPQKIPSFVKMKNIPFVVAPGDATRLFDIGSASFPSAANVETNEIAGKPFVAGRLNEAAQWKNRFAQVACSDFPRERGTVEFWMRPLWSATDFDFKHATMRFQMFKAGPVSLAYNIDPNSGGSGKYNTAYLELQIHAAGFSRAQLYLEAGKWYHIALTWNVDGRNSECDIFVNGRKKDYYHYAMGMAPTVSPSKLDPPPQTVRFGSGHQYGGSPQGELYDELRISRIVRYREDFDLPAKAPFQPDNDTVLLMHLDGNAEAVTSGKTIATELVEGSKLW